MKYAIYSDVDGTIYSHSQEFHPETKKHIKKAQDKGIEFIMCTGNPYFLNMRQMAKELDVDYFVGSNGAVVFDVKKDEEIILNTLTAEEGQKVLDIMNELEIGADWWDSKNIYVGKHVEPVVREVLKNVIDRNAEVEMLDVITGPIHKIEGYTTPDEKGIKKIDLLEERLKGIGLQVARMKPHHLEVTKNNVSKGEAVKLLSAKLGIELDNVMTIGDSANDHSMFEVTKFSYAMGNANELTKSKANFHTSAVEQNGLGEAIIDFMFRNRLTDNFNGQK